jgi:hypothetical protein
MEKKRERGSGRGGRPMCGAVKEGVGSGWRQDARAGELGHSRVVALVRHTGVCPWTGEVGEAARWGPCTVPGGGGLVQMGLNPIQISNEFKLIQNPPKFG